MKIRKILIPIDFSECSINAMEYGLQINSKIGAEIILLNTYEAPIPFEDDQEYGKSIVAKNYQKDALDKFENVKLKSKTLSDTEHEFHVYVGKPSEAIASFANTKEINLIVMGTHGASNKLKEVLGSTAYAVINQRTCPVLTIPHNYHLERLKKITLATSLKNEDDQLEGLDVVYWLADCFSAEVHLLSIVDDVNDISEKQSSQVREMHKFFEDAPHAFHFVQGTEVREKINGFIQQEHVDLLVLIPRDHVFLDTLFNRSISRGFAHHTKIPLLTFSH